MKILRVPDSNFDGGGNIVLPVKPFVVSKQLKHYFLAMNVGAIQAAAAAGSSWLGSAAAHAVNESTPVMGIRALLWTVGVAFLGFIFNYLSRNPIPIDENQPEQPAKP